MKSIQNILFFGLMALNPCAVWAQAEPWTWLHRKVFDEHEARENGKKKEIAFCKNDCDGFTQLVFSWNAFRKQEGYFSFWAQVRNKKNATWSVWHKMAEWGAGVQRSFIGDSDGATRYVHVRLESDLSDAFRIKIVAHDNADLSLVKSFSVSLSDYQKFKAEYTHKKKIKLPSVYVHDIPKKAQLALNHPRNNHLCSPTSCSMVTSFFKGEDIDPVDFAHKAFDAGLDTYGSWPFNTAHAFERCDGKIWFAAARLNSFQGLHNQLQKGFPVVVSVRGQIQGAPKSYDNGHLLVVVGWDAHGQSVVCHDPAFDHADKVVKRYPIKSFLSAWERSARLAYLAEPTVKLF